MGQEKRFHFQGIFVMSQISQFILSAFVKSQNFHYSMQNIVLNNDRNFQLFDPNYVGLQGFVNVKQNEFIGSLGFEREFLICTNKKLS